MSGFWNGSGGMVVGGALQGAAGMLGAAASNRAARQARDRYALETGAPRMQLGNAFYGQPFGDSMTASYDLQQALIRGDAAAAQAAQQRMTQAQQGMGGPMLQQLQQIAGSAQAGGRGIERDYRRESARLRGADARAMGEFDRQAAGINARAMGEEDMAGAWGRGRDRLIREDSARSITNANDTALATLAASGFGNSTAAGQAVAGNAREGNRDMQRQLQALSEAQIDRQMGARRSGVQTMTGLAGTRAGLNAGRVGNEYQRSAGLTGIQQGNLQRNLAYQQMPVDASMNVLQSSVMNPWLGQNTSQYYPGSSGLASAMNNIGGGLAAVGAQGYGFNQAQQALQQMQQQQIQQQMYQMLASMNGSGL